MVGAKQSQKKHTSILSVFLNQFQKGNIQRHDIFSDIMQKTQQIRGLSCTTQALAKANMESVSQMSLDVSSSQTLGHR